MFPPVHHFVEEFNIVFYRTEGEGDFLPHTVPNLTQHTTDINAQHLEVGQLTFREAAAGFVHLVTGGEKRLGVKRRVFFRKLTVKAEGDGDVLQERTFTDGQSKRVVDLVFRETSTGGRQRNGAFPNGIDQVKMRLRERSGLDDEGGVFFSSANRVVLDVEVLDDFGLVLDKAQ